jgi:hypothetical protein
VVCYPPIDMNADCCAHIRRFLPLCADIRIAMTAGQVIPTRHIQSVTQKYRLRN